MRERERAGSGGLLIAAAQQRSGAAEARRRARRASVFALFVLPVLLPLQRHLQTIALVVSIDPVILPGPAWSRAALGGGGGELVARRQAPRPSSPSPRSCPTFVVASDTMRGPLTDGANLAPFWIVQNGERDLENNLNFDSGGLLHNVPISMYAWVCSNGKAYVCVVIMVNPTCLCQMNDACFARRQNDRGARTQTAAACSPRSPADTGRAAAQIKPHNTYHQPGGNRFVVTTMRRTMGAGNGRGLK